MEVGKGDFVVYPTHGVGKVTGVEEREIAGQKLQLFVVSFEKERMILRVPIEKVKDSGLRKLSNRKVIDTALKTLKGRVRVKRTMWSRRAQEYSERQMYQAALERLARELAAVEQVEHEAAVDKLETLLSEA